jgi:expansin (peptidoglycan-binding protein)
MTGPMGTAEVELIDCCPECAIGDLDTTQSVFQQVVGDLSVGRQKITWEFV